MGENDAAERRKYHRIATDQVISFSEIDQPQLLGVSKNVSTGGIRFEAVGVEINLGDVLRVTFRVADRTVVADGTVVWATDVDPITQEIGIQFHDIEPEAVELLEDTVGASLEPVDLH